MQFNMRRRAHRAGFTLIELLTVVGIICILLAILVPGVSLLWRYAKNASTTSEMGAIANAINNYKLDMGALPGPLPDSVLYGCGVNGIGANNVVLNGNGMVSPTPGTMQATSTENMLLGILGGLQVGPTGVSYNPPAPIGNGPIILNMQTYQQKSAYYPMTKGDISDDGFGNYTSWTVQNPQNGIASGTFIIPEFLDRFATPRPIIYLRARIAAPNIVDTPAGAGTTDQSSQYYSQEMAPYWVSGTRETTTGVFTPNPSNMLFPSYNETTNGTATLASLYLTAQSFFANPGYYDPTQATPRAKDSFMLISAGLDGYYGSKDDIIWPKPQ